MKKICLFMAVLAFSFSVDVSLYDYLQSISNNDPDYKKIELDAQSMEGAYQSIQAMYDTQIFGAYTYGVQDTSYIGFFDVSTNAYVKIPLENNKSYVTNLGLNKKFVETGTIFEATYARIDSYSDLMGSTMAVNNPTYKIKITQPLLQDFMGILSSLPLQRMKIQKEIIALSIQENKENYYKEAINLYYDWLSLTLALEPLINSYQNAQDLYKQINDQYKNDAVLKSDLLQARSALLQLENALNSTLYSWNNLALMIHNKMGKDFVPVKDWNKLSYKPQLCEDFCLMSHEAELGDIRLFLTYEKVLDQYVLDKIKIDREKMPRLNVFVEGSKYKNSNGATDSFSDLNKNDYALGLSFSAFFENSGVKGQELSLEAEIAKKNFEKNKIKSNLGVLYKASILNLKTAVFVENNAKQVAQNYKDVLDIETKRFQLGKTQLFNITEHRNNYISSKIEHLRKMIELTKINLSIAELNDTLLPLVEKILEEK